MSSGNCLRRGVRSGLLIAVLAVGLCGLLACSEQFSTAEEALGKTVERIEQGVLPPILEETEAMLRNYVNFLPALLDICQTPISDLGEFESQVPELQRAQQQFGDTFRLNNSNGEWQATWRDVFFGDRDGQLTVDAGTPSVDVMVTVDFRNAGAGTVFAVPFSLPSSDLGLTYREAGAVHACENGAPEGFYLFQDPETGMWTLGWCTEAPNTVFQGEISGSNFSRVSRKVSPEATEEVSSLTVSETSALIQFEETAVPMVAEGIRFFVRPGEFMDFELRIARAGGEASSIVREELRLEAFDPLKNPPLEQFLPPGLNLNPGDFQWVSALPLWPTGEPDFMQRNDFATFIWRAETPGGCQAGASRWHLRFHTETSALFSGFVGLADDNTSPRSLEVSRVGRCQEGRFEFENDGEQLVYECVVDDAADNGYDICVSGARRLQFSPAVAGVRDPARVWIGSDPEHNRPPAQDPFTVVFDLEMQERQSTRNLELDNSVVTLQGTTDAGGSTGLRGDQVSLEVLCHPPDDGPVHVRVVGEGEYATERFEGSRYEFDDLEFTDAQLRRVPDRGTLTLLTRNEDDTVEILASQFQDANGQVTANLDVTMTLDTLQLTFHSTADLTLE